MAVLISTTGKENIIYSETTTMCMKRRSRNLNFTEVSTSAAIRSRRIPFPFAIQTGIITQQDWDSITKSMINVLSEGWCQDLIQSGKWMLIIQLTFRATGILILSSALTIMN